MVSYSNGRVWKKRLAKWYLTYTAKRWEWEGLAQWYLTYSEEVGRKGAHNLVLILSHNIQPIDIKHPENKIKLFFNDLN